MKMIILLLLIILLSGCFQNTRDTIVRINGKSEALAGKMIYLKDYDHFGFLNENYILDSCKVDEQGKFKFELPTLKPKLITISANNTPPGSYQVFRKTPEMYTYSFCANFFAFSPTIFIEPNNNYEVVQWDLRNGDESVKYKDAKSNVLRAYYRGHDFRRDIEDREIGGALNIEPRLAWNIVQEQRDSLLENFEINSKSENSVFKHYLKTEIYLGAINDFLVWYLSQKNYEIEETFYKQFMDEYKKEIWSSFSVEYFKLTERYIAYQMNKDKGTLQIYYKPDDEKVKYGNKYAGENIKEKYVNNLIQLAERSQ